MAERSISIRLSLKDGETVRRALMQLGADGQKALASIEKASLPASRGLLAADAAARGAQGAFTAFGARLGAVGSVLTALGPGGIAAAAAIGAVTVAVKAIADASRRAVGDLNRLEDQAAKLGVGVEALQEWRFAFEQNGVAVESLETGLQHLGVRLGQIGKGEGQEVKNAFDRLGVSVVDAEGRLKSIEQIMPEIADGLAAMADQNQRLATTQELFGKGAGGMLILLQQGAQAMARLAAEARDLGLVFDQAMVARAAKVNNQLATMERLIDVQLKSAFVDFAPLVLGAAVAFADLARWVGEVVDGFKEIENRTTRGLERRLAEINAAIEAARAQPAVTSGIARANQQGQVAGLTAERDRIAAVLADRAAAGAKAGEKPGVSAAVRERIDALMAEGDALRSLAGAHEIDERAVRAVTAAIKTDEEIRRLKLDELGDEAKAIEDLVKRNEGWRRSIELRQQARALELKLDPVAAYRQEIDTLNELEATGLVSSEALARAHEDAERRRLGASREAADGIQRALIDIKNASEDMATRWELDIHRMNFAARDAFIDIASGARSLADALISLGQALQRTILGGIYDRTIGALAGSLLDDFFGPVPARTRHAGGMAAAGPVRAVPALAFAGAPRFHSGRPPGVGPGEVPAVLLANERVLTEAQQQNTARTIAGLAALAARQGSWASAPVVNVTVHNSAPGARARAETRAGAGGGVDIDLFVEAIEDRLADRVASGAGPLARVLDDRGANPLAGGTFR